MTPIWHSLQTLEKLNAARAGTLIEHLDIRFVEIGDDYLRGCLPVDHRTMQPYGLLHGGATVALAETLGSVGAMMCVDPARSQCVGLEINANHVRAVRGGVVTGTARPLHIGARTHVWSIEVVDEAARRICISRMTVAIV